MAGELHLAQALSLFLQLPCMPLMTDVLGMFCLVTYRDGECIGSRCGCHLGSDGACTVQIAGHRHPVHYEAHSHDERQDWEEEEAGHDADCLACHLDGCYCHLQYGHEHFVTWKMMMRSEVRVHQCTGTAAHRTIMSQRLDMHLADRPVVSNDACCEASKPVQDHTITTKVNTFCCSIQNNEHRGNNNNWGKLGIVFSSV